MSRLQSQPKSGCISEGGGDNAAHEKTLHTPNKMYLSTLNARRTPRTTPKTSTSSVDILTSTPSARQRLHKCRRAISLEDLTPEKKKHRIREEVRQGKRCTAQSPHSKQVKELAAKATLEKLAAQRIYQVFTLNAWQKERKRAENLKLEIKQSTGQVDDFHKQTAVLMQMLNAEKHRTTQAGHELQAKIEQMEDSNASLNLASQEKLEREQQLVALEIQLTKLETKLENDVDEYNDKEEHYNTLKQDLQKIKLDVEKHVKENRKLDQMRATKQRTIADKDEAIKSFDNQTSQLNERALKELQSLKSANTKQINDCEMLTIKRKERDAATEAVKKATSLRAELLSRIKAMKKESEERDVQRDDLEQSISYKELEIAGLRAHADNQQTLILEMSWEKRVRRMAKSAAPLVNYILTQRIS